VTPRRCATPEDDRPLEPGEFRRWWVPFSELSLPGSGWAITEQVLVRRTGTPKLILEVTTSNAFTEMIATVERATERGRLNEWTPEDGEPPAAGLPFYRWTEGSLTLHRARVFAEARPAVYLELTRTAGEDRIALVGLESARHLGDAEALLKVGLRVLRKLSNAGRPRLEQEAGADWRERAARGEALHREGATYAEAAEKVRASVATLRRWRRRAGN
jgi:hypothetical protein